MYNISHYIENGRPHISYVIEILEYIEYRESARIYVKAYRYLYADKDDIELKKKIIGKSKIQLFKHDIITRKEDLIKEIFDF